MFVKAKPRILMARHGATTFTAPDSKDDRVAGHENVPLTREGILEAYRLAKLFSREPIAGLHTSDLDRSWDTTKIIQKLHPWKPGIQTYEALRSWKAGPTMEGKKVREVNGKLLFFALVMPALAPVGGESFNTFKSDAIPCLKGIFDLAEEHPEFGAELIVAHHRILRLADGWVRRGCKGLLLDPHALLAEQHIPAGGWLEFELTDGRWEKVRQSNQPIVFSGEYAGGMTRKNHTISLRPQAPIAS